MNVFKRGLAVLTILSMCMTIGFQPFGSNLSKLNFSTVAADVTESGSCGENVNWEIDSGGTLRIFGTGNMYNYAMLTTDENKNPFRENENVENVIIEDGVTSIGDYAFYSSKIKSIEIPDSITEIGNGAFSSCSNLISIEIPESVLNIKNQAFFHCDNLETVVIKGRIAEIGFQTFSGCSNITQITLPDSLESISGAAFEYCSKLSDVYYEGTEEQWNSIDIGTVNDYLTSATIHFNSTGSEEITTTEPVTTEMPTTEPIMTEPPTEENPTYEGEITDSGECGIEGDNVKWELYENGTLRIYGSGDMKNYDCIFSSLSPWYSKKDLIKEIVIEDGITNIGSWAFYNCSSLTSIIIPDGVTSIDEAAFFKCLGLTSITIPDSVTNIGKKAFTKCSCLTSIAIPDSVTSIGAWAFSDCIGLLDVVIKGNVQNFQHDALADSSPFSGCKLNTFTIPGEIEFKTNSFMDTTVDTLIISEGSKILTMENSGLLRITKNLIIPDSIEKIEFFNSNGNILFAGTDLESIKVSENNMYYSDIDGVLFNKDKTKLLFYPSKKIDKEYIIPNSVSSIQKRAFMGCNLSSVILGSGITITGRDFNYEFFSCENLTSVTFSNNIEIIGGYTFNNCPNLTDVYFEGTEEQWNKIKIVSKEIFSATIHYNSTGSSTTPITTTTTQTTTQTTTTTTATTYTEKEQRIKNLQIYLSQYERAMNNYIKAIKSESINDKKETDKASGTTEGYKKLMENDQKADSRLLTFTDFSIPQKAKEDAYEVLYDFLVNSLDAANQKNIIDFEIDNSQNIIEIEASMINKIYDAVRKGCENPGKGTGSNGYTVDLKIYGGIFNIGFGKGTITKGNKKYDLIYCSDKDTVSRVMNQYMNDLCNEVKKQYKEACMSLWKYFLDKSMINEIRTDILKSELEDKADYFMQKGYGKLIENIIIVKETYDEFKDFKSNSSYDLFKKAVEGKSEDDMKLLYKKIKNGSVSNKDVKNKAVSSAMKKLEDARKKAESAFYDYIYEDNTIQTGKEPNIWKIMFQCPVNVDVIDTETQEIVGYIRDNEVYNNDSIEMELSDDVKIIGLPKDKNYKFILTATDEGTMNITYENIETHEYTNFYDIPLTKDVQYTQQMDTSSESIPPLMADDGTEIESDERFESQNDSNLITINTNIINNGSVYGDGQYVKGDSVMLSAVADYGYKFTGWYEDDSLISLQGFFRFTAINDRTIEARFEKILHEVTSCSWKVSEAYADNALFWTYKDGDYLNIDFSLYTENSNTKAILCYADDVEKELTLESEDGIHYLMDDISVEDLKSIMLYDNNSDEIAALDYVESSSDVNDGEETGSITTTTTTITTSIKSTTTTTSTITTPIEPLENKLGDVNVDNMVDAVDASFILQEYALLSTGNSGNFTDIQKSIADINSDGMIDAVDASLVLQYYAYISTGGKESTEEFFNKNN